MRGEIPSCSGAAQLAVAQMLGNRWPTLVHWQSMRSHTTLYQQPQPGNGHWNLRASLSPERRNHAGYVYSLALLEGALLSDTCGPSQTLRS